MGDDDAGAPFAMTSKPGARVYRPSLVKCRSTVIYLSRIDASPEVNGRVVTISRRTGQSVRTANSRVCANRAGAREYANIRAVWGLLRGPTRCSLSLSSTVPATIFSHEPLNYFAGRSNGDDRGTRNENRSWYEWRALWYFHFWRTTRGKIYGFVDTRLERGVVVATKII